MEERLRVSLPLVDAVGTHTSKKIILGGAQLGLKYGITNKVSHDLQKNAFQLLSFTSQFGIDGVDTAFAYGNSEQNIGYWLRSKAFNISPLKIYTKFPPYEDFDQLSSNYLIDLQNALRRLQCQKIHAILLHRAEPIGSSQDKIKGLFKEIKSTSLVGALGISVQTEAEILNALENEEVDIIQLPFNILEYRWDTILPKIQQAKKKRNLTVIARSVFLQGLLNFGDASDWIKAGHYDPSDIEDFLKSFETRLSCSRTMLLINYVLSQRWIDKVVIGFENVRQFQEVMVSLSSQQFSNDLLQEITLKRPKVSAMTLNPASWNSKK